MDFLLCNTLDLSLTTCRLDTTVASSVCTKRGAGSTGWRLGFGEDLCSLWTILGRSVHEFVMPVRIIKCILGSSTGPALGQDFDGFTMIC